MQELEDRRRDRQAITLIIRQAQKFHTMYSTPSGFPWEGEGSFDTGRGIVSALPEWRGQHEIGGGGQVMPSLPSGHRHRAA